MLRITDGEYTQRFENLRCQVAKADVDVFIVSSFDSIYYLTGAGFEPLERRDEKDHPGGG